MPSPFPPDSLWDFSLALYAQPGIADACLHMQDAHGINVNVLLWCAWLECFGMHMEVHHFQEAHHQVDEWDQHYIIPLRQLRRRMKVEFGTHYEPIEVVRRQIKQAELAAEKELQLRLQRLTYTWLQMQDQLAPVTTDLVASKGGIERGSFEGKNLRHYLNEAGVNRSTIDSLIQCLSGALRNI